jgi:excisionase family DNA binding protein
MSERYYTTMQVADILGIDDGTVRKLYDNRSLKGFRCSGTNNSRRISETSLRELLKREHLLENPSYVKTRKWAWIRYNFQPVEDSRTRVA